MKIAEVLTHMSVSFGVRKHEFKHFSKKSKKLPNLEMRLIPELGIEIKNHEDCVIIPMSNLVSFRIEEAKPKKLRAVTAEEADVLGLNEPDVEELEEAEAAKSKPAAKLESKPAAKPRKIKK